MWSRAFPNKVQWVFLKKNMTVEPVWPLIFFPGPQQPSDQVRLKFYSYYKQATVGKCNTSGPGMFSLDLVGKVVFLLKLIALILIHEWF